MKYLLFTLLFLVASFGYSDSKTDTTIVPKKAGGAILIKGGNVGIGTTIPPNPLSIDSRSFSSTPAGGGMINVFGDVNKERILISSSAQTPVLQMSSSAGTYSSPTAATAGMPLFILQGGGHDGTNWNYNNVKITGWAEENQTPSAKGTYLSFLTTPIGSTTVGEKMRITAAGNVGISASPTAGQLLKVGNGTAKYVHFALNNAGTYPEIGNGLAIGANFATGTSEMNFWNTQTGATKSFEFKQQTGASAATSIMTMLPDGKVGIGVNPPTVALDVNGTIKAGVGIILAGTPTTGMVGEVISFSSFPVIQVLVSDQTNENTWRDVSGVATQVVTKGTWFYEMYLPTQYGTTSGYLKAGRIGIREGNNVIISRDYPMIGNRLGINPATNSNPCTEIFSGKVVLASDLTLKLSGLLNAYDSGATGSLSMRFDLSANPYFAGPAYIRFTRML